MTLLYRTAEWHAFAKLRLHTESTLQHLEKLTTELGQLMRKFRDTTQSRFVTFELPKETGARKQRQKSGKGKEKAAAGSTTSGAKPTTLNLFTYKWHALGDYVCAIRLFGGTDGFSTQVVSNIYFYISNFSQLPANRVNLLIKSLNDCMDRPTNGMQSNKSPNVIEDLNVPVWRLTGRGSTPVLLSENQWITKMITWRVTRTCGITSLHRKIDLWTYLTPFGITEATLLTMYALQIPIIVIAG
jgi:hypothetical protein